VIKTNRYNGAIWPKRDIPPEEKDEKYCINNAKAIQGLYEGNGAAWGYDAQSFFDTMRAYSNGEQETSQYKSFLTSTNTSSGEPFVLYDDSSEATIKAKRGGYYNLLWQNLSPASKIMSSLQGALGSYDYDLYCDTIDANSRGLIEFEKYKKFFESQDQKFQIEYKRKAGIPFDEQIDFPKTLEELQAYEAREGFKLNIAKAIQKVLRYSFDISDWDGNIRKKLIDDLICLGYCATQDYYDDEDKCFKTKWLDPKRVVVQYSHEYDYADSDWAGYYSLWSISNIRRKLIKEGKYTNEDDLYQLAHSNANNFNNPVLKWGERHSMLDPTSNTYLYDDLKVAVLEAYWIDTDTYKTLHYNNNSGREMSKEIGLNDKITPLTKNQIAKGKKQEVTETNIRVVYQCSWIVGSDICFDWGKMHMAARPQPSKPKLPIHVEQLLQPSIMYRLRPILDSIALVWLQHQNDMAKMITRGYAVNMAMLMGITMNGKQLDPADILTLWKQTGMLPYMYGYTGNYGGGAATPVTPIEGGLGNRIQETAMALETNFKLIEEIVGINPVAMGSTPTEGSQVGTTEMAMQATSNVLKPIVEGIFETKKSIGESLMLRYQIGVRVSSDIREALSGVVSPADVRTLMLAEHNGVQYGLSLKPKPTDARKAEFKRYMELEVTKGTLSSVEGMYFIERMESGADMIDLRQEISYAIEKATERKQKEALMTIQEQNKGNMELEQQKGQNEQGKITAEAQAKIAEEVARGQIKERLTKLDGNYKLMDRLFEDVAKEKELDESRRQAKSSV
jgi:hypothetical protein